MKCAVKDCTNHADEGLFIGLLCSPCHTFIKGDGGLYSQAHRNSRIMIDAAVSLEREAIAKFIKPTEEHRRDASWGYVGGDEGVAMLDDLVTSIQAGAHHEH